jgi:hypothetical protein
MALEAATRTAYPNVLIIGAMKSGTSSLHHYLDRHREIAMSTPKELNFFGRPDWWEARHSYAQHFDPSARFRGESTPKYTWYPHEPCVASRVHALSPDAKLIYVVRDPFERMVSHWIQAAYLGERRSFEECLSDHERPDNLFVCAGRYASQLERYLRYFDRSQILVVDQADLLTARSATLDEVFAFLGLEGGLGDEVLRDELNVGSEKRGPTRIGSPLWKHCLNPLVRRMPAPARDRIAPPLTRALTRRLRRPEIASQLRATLTPLFRAETDRLRELTGKDFATWSV